MIESLKNEIENYRIFIQYACKRRIADLTRVALLAESGEPIYGIGSSNERDIIQWVAKVEALEEAVKAMEMGEVDIASSFAALS